mgnify:FL=1
MMSLVGVISQNALGRQKGRVGPDPCFCPLRAYYLKSFRYGALHVHATVDLDNLTAYVA